MDTRGLEVYRAGGWHGWLSGEVGLRDGEPVEAYLSHPHELVRDRPGGRTWRVRVGDTTYYVKHVSPRYTSATEGGWRLGKRVRWTVRRSPVMRTLTVTRAMERRGLCVPPVVHAARRGWGMGREELVVTREVPCVSMKAAMYGCPPAEVRGVMELLGRKVAALHAAGVVHGHLLIGHLFLTEDRSDVIFIDNDENNLYTGPVPEGGRRMNLEQLAGQTVDWYGAAWHDFFRSYFDASGLSRPEARRMWASVLRNARRRAAHP